MTLCRWLLAICLVHAQAPVHALDLSPDFSRDDTKVHAGASFLLNTASYVVLRKNGLSKTEAFFTAIAITTAIGVMKEIVDQPLETQDIGANLAGIGASSIVVFAVDWF